MAEPTNVVRCPHCGFPYPMTDKQREVYVGRNMGCMNCGRPFPVNAPPPPDPPTEPPAAIDSSAAAAGVAAAGGAVAAATGAGFLSDATTPLPPAESGTTGPAAAGPAVAGAAAAGEVTRTSNPWAAASFGAGLVFFVLLAVATITAFVTETVRAAADPGGRAATVVLLVLSVLTGLTAIAAGVAGVRRARRPMTGGRGLSYAGLALGAGGLFVAACTLSLLVPRMTEARDQARRDQCYRNFKQIGMAIVDYARNNPGTALPGSLDELAASGMVPAEVLVCPGAAAPPPPASTPTTGPTTAPAFPQTYFYLGNGKTAGSADDTVLLYEEMGNHPDGAHFLFADGKIVFANPQQAAQLLTELKRGQNPPPTARAVRP